MFSIEFSDNLEILVMAKCRQNIAASLFPVCFCLLHTHKKRLGNKTCVKTTLIFTNKTKTKDNESDLVCGVTSEILSVQLDEVLGDS